MHYYLHWYITPSPKASVTMVNLCGVIDIYIYIYIYKYYMPT